MIGWPTAKINTREKRGTYLQRKIGIPLHVAVLAAWPALAFPRYAYLVYIATAVAVWAGGKAKRLISGPRTRQFWWDCASDFWIGQMLTPVLMGWHLTAWILFGVWCLGFAAIWRFRLTDEIESHGSLDDAIALARQIHAEPHGPGLVYRWSTVARFVLPLRRYAGDRVEPV